MFTATVKIGLVVTAVVAQATTAIDPPYKELVSYGALGIVCAWLLWERSVDRKADRATRHKQAEAIQENTLATFELSTKISQLKDVIWLFLGAPERRAHERSHQPPPQPVSDKDTTPRLIKKPETRHPKNPID